MSPSIRFGALCSFDGMQDPAPIRGAWGITWPDARLGAGHKYGSVMHRAERVASALRTRTGQVRIHGWLGRWGWAFPRRRITSASHKATRHSAQGGTHVAT
jgi:hypothetical protein